MDHFSPQVTAEGEYMSESDGQGGRTGVLPLPRDLPRPTHTSLCHPPHAVEPHFDPSLPLERTDEVTYGVEYLWYRDSTGTFRRTDRAFPDRWYPGDPRPFVSTEWPHPRPAGPPPEHPCVGQKVDARYGTRMRSTGVGHESNDRFQDRRDSTTVRTQ